MLIACIVIVSLFVLFILVTYLITIKKYTFKIDEKDLTIYNRGSKLKILLDNKNILTISMPQLINGEVYDIKIDEKEYNIRCQTNSYGNKLRVEIYKEGKLIDDNKVVLNNKNKKSDK